MSHCITSLANGSNSGTNAVVSLHNCLNIAASSVELTVPNAVELSWTVPHAVPSDRTEVSIDCST